MYETAFLIGLIGSVHCMGMCGPIALALPLTKKTSGNIEGIRMRMILGRVLYNFGRIATYALLGGIIGVVGHQIKLAGYQQALSISTGVVILLFTILPSKAGGQLLRLPVLNRIWGFWQKVTARLFRTPGMSSMFIIGLMNGFLPCGLVYAGLAGSLITGSVQGGSFYMMLFGLGTLPLMLVTSMLPGVIKYETRKKLNRLIPIAAMALGVLFILRGMSLGIPFISPDLAHQSAMIHHP